MRLHDTLDYRAREHAGAAFAIQGDRRLSYAEAREASDRLANALIDEGLEAGDRVAWLSKNSIEHALFYYAASKAGVVPVPLNYRLAAPEWEFIVNDAGAKLLFAAPELARAIAPVRDSLEAVKRFVAVGGDVAGWDRFDDFAAAGASTRPRREIRADDDAYQIYTSSTTNQPKGTVIQHRAVAAQLHQAVMAFGGGPGQRTLIVAPLYHAAAAVTTFATVQMGGALYIQEDFVPADVVRALSEERIRMSLLVPAMIQFCLGAVPDVAERDYGDLELMVYGASPIAEATLRRALEVFQCDFIQGYGMTETTAAATYLFQADHRAALDGRSELLLSAGRPLLGTEIRI
ncbi:MAG TPA: AMP-binding protein, partial [Myxococcota bacterium]|nr:AMP-binding protein [Myxococcota bacterium]